MRTYLDHAASASLRPQAVAAMVAAWAEPGNPSSAHTSGRAARRVVEDAREALAAALGAHPDELLFCSGGTEANHLALTGLTTPARPRLAVSAVEHSSVLGAVGVLSDVDVLAVDGSGRVGDLDKIGTATALASVQWVNSETGIVQPVGRVVDRAHAVGALAHADAAQALGHVAVDFQASGLDLLTVVAHKVGGPAGIGALLVRRGVRLRPHGFGGGQEAGLRSGTVPAALCAGFAAAATACVASLDAEAARLRVLHDRLIAGVGAIAGASVNCDQPCSPAIVNVTFAGLRADDLALLLDRAGFDCSTGSACEAGVHRPSPVLLAMGRSLEAASGSLRFSFGPSTTPADVEALIAALPDAVTSARAAR